MRGEARAQYTRDQLLSLRLAASSAPCSDVRQRIDELITSAPRQPYRGCRAGRHRRPNVLHSVADGYHIPVITGNRTASQLRLLTTGSNVNNIIRVRLSRHAAPIPQTLKFGAMNVHSSNDKIDDILSTRRERNIDVLLLCETWHDQDSVFIRRLRTDGMRVIERARPRTANSLSTNHGGVVIAASNGVHLQPVNVGGPRSTFEFACGRVTSCGVSRVILLIYRPGSAAICSTFFDEFSDIMDYAATLEVPLIVTGDINIHLERPDDPDSRRFTDILSTYGLTSRVNAATHDRGGWLDVVATRTDLAAPVINVIDPGFSDHRLIEWTDQLQRPAPIYRQVTCRPWRRLDLVCRL